LDTSEELARGRESYSSSAWRTSYDSLVRADGLAPLAAEDLERLAISAYMLGREDEWMQVLERAYRAHSEGGEARRAVRCAFWIGIQLALKGEMGPATGWLAGFLVLAAGALLGPLALWWSRGRGTLPAAR